MASSMVRFPIIPCTPSARLISLCDVAMSRKTMNLSRTHSTTPVPALVSNMYRRSIAPAEASRPIPPTGG